MLKLSDSVTVLQIDADFVHNEAGSLVWNHAAPPSQWSTSPRDYPKSCKNDSRWPKPQKTNLGDHVRSGPLVDRHDFFADRFADVLAERTVKAIVLELLENLRAPAGAAGNGKDRGEQIGRDA